MLLMADSAILAPMAGRPRTRLPKKHETELQSLFVKRVLEEMEARQIPSITALSGRVGAPPQRTLNAVLKEGHVPGMTVVSGIAAALGIHAWELLKEADLKSASTTNVSQLPARYPPIFVKKSDSARTRRNKSRA